MIVANKLKYRLQFSSHASCIDGPTVNIVKTTIS